MKLFDAVNWDEVKETAKFYYTDETTTLNLYPALIISILLLFLLVPILGAIPTIDLFPSTSGGKRIEHSLAQSSEPEHPEMITKHDHGNH